MSDTEETHLMRLAKSIHHGNRRNAIRICRKQVKSVLTPGKKLVWAVWHQQFTKPDTEPVEIIAYGKTVTITPSQYELMTMLSDGIGLQHFEDLKTRFKSIMIEHEYAYHNARLSYLLMTYLENLGLEMVNHTSKQTPPPKATRRHKKPPTSQKPQKQPKKRRDH